MEAMDNCIPLGRGKWLNCKPETLDPEYFKGEQDIVGNMGVSYEYYNIELRSEKEIHKS